MTASKKYLILVVGLLMIALTAFTVQAILNPDNQGETAYGTSVTGSVVDVPEDDADDLAGAINKAADWIFQGNK